jgi:hypothetical protein
MRVAVILAALLLAACASQKLALLPPPGVDLSGRWKLNDADSDEPQRVLQSQTTASGTPAAADPSGGRSGGRRGRGSAGGPGGGLGGPTGPSAPPVGTMSEGLRWPGKDVEIKQSAGVVTVMSGGRTRIYKPAEAQKKPKKPPRDEDRSRDMPARGGGDAPSLCGWDDKTLVVQSGDPDDDHSPFEERYSLSEDGQRLVEVVGFHGGRSNGFTMFRVWDRVPATPP